MDATPWIQSFNYGRQSYQTDRTIEAVMEDIKALEKSVSDTVEHEFLDRKAYCLSNSIIFNEQDIKNNEATLQSLEDMAEEFKGPDWAVTKVLYETRVKNARRTLEEHTQELAKLKETVKSYIFSVKRKKLDEEIEEIKLSTLDDVDVKPDDQTPTKEP